MGKQNKGTLRYRARRLESRLIWTLQASGGKEHKYEIFKVVNGSFLEEPWYLCIERNADATSTKFKLVSGGKPALDTISTISTWDPNLLQNEDLPIETMVEFLPSIPLSHLAILTKVIHKIAPNYSMLSRNLVSKFSVYSQSLFKSSLDW